MLSPDNSVITGGTPLHWAVAKGGVGQVRSNFDVTGDIYIDIDININIDSYCFVYCCCY